MTFSGTSGLQYERDILEKVQEYTISMWLKFDELPWDLGSDMVIFDFEPGFFCLLKTTRALSCKPQSLGNPDDQLSFVFEPLIDHWYILILKVN